MPELAEGYHYTTKRAGACYLVCLTCGLIGDDLQMHWDMSKTKKMHETGTGHKTLYVAPRTG